MWREKGGGEGGGGGVKGDGEKITARSRFEPAPELDPESSAFPFGLRPFHFLHLFNGTFPSGARWEMFR